MQAHTLIIDAADKFNCFNLATKEKEVKSNISIVFSMGIIITADIMIPIIIITHCLIPHHNIPPLLALILVSFNPYLLHHILILFLLPGVSRRA